MFLLHDTKKTILEYFRQLKFFTNNDFAFIDVHNEHLFYQNSAVLLKIVKMLQDIKLKTEMQNQFLGDLFEGFLDQGVKQSEGQFFTPTPIVKFLISSLPLQQIINETEIPQVIDYACGAGHFLNEYAEQIKPFVAAKNGKIADYYGAITGIEKEYRLSKVSKVASFMYGQDNIKIIYADALSNINEIKDNSFSVLVANPPYSVKGFLETLTDEERSNFELFNEVSDIAKNNSIETFFVERAAQLLKTGGVAAIILPSSVLSNGNIYIKCREIILQHFDVVAIAEFGSGTFGKTGTNTVTLFLRRKSVNPSLAEHYKNRVDTWFNGDETKNAVFEDYPLLEAYCQHIGIPIDTYKNLFANNFAVVTKAVVASSGNNNEEIGIATDSKFDQTKQLMNYDIIMEYRQIFENDTIAKNIKKKKITAKYSKVDRENDLDNYVRNAICEIEKDKLYYFMLAKRNPQPVVVVKSPADSKTNKQFLGYEWSGAKGNEGIKYFGANISDDEENEIARNKGINSIQTPLFNPHNLADTDKINSIIRHNFVNNTHGIPERLRPFVTMCNLVDMLDFSRATFDKQIKTIATKKVQEQSKYPLKSIDNILVDVLGDKPKIGQDQILESGTYPVITQEREHFVSGYSNHKKCVTDLPLIVFGDHSCSLKHVDFQFVRGADGTQLLKTNQDEVITKYLFYYLQTIKIENAEKYERHFKYLKTTKIPVPEDLDIQRNIVSECEDVDKEYNKSRTSIEKYKRKIAEVILKLKGDAKKLKRIAPYATARVPYSQIAPESYITTDNLLQNCEGMKPYENTPNIDSAIRYKKGDILVSNIRPYLKKIWFADRDGGCSPDVLVFRPTTDVYSRFVYYAMKQDSFFDYMMQGAKGMKMPRGDKNSIPNYEIIVPENQKAIVSEIEQYETKITEAKAIMDGCSDRKKQILEKYLK